MAGARGASGGNVPIGFGVGQLCSFVSSQIGSNCKKIW